MRLKNLWPRSVYFCFLALFSISLTAISSPDDLVKTDPASQASEAAPHERLLEGEELVRSNDLVSLIDTHRRQGNYSAALEPAAELLELRERAQGTDHWETISTQQLLTSLKRIAALSPESQAEVARAYALLKESADKRQQEVIDEAVTQAGSALEIRRRLLGDDDYLTLAAMSDFGHSLQKAERTDEAEPLLRESLDGRRSLLGPEHAETLESLDRWAQLLLAQRRHDEAEQVIHDVLEKGLKLYGSEHEFISLSYFNLGSLYYATGKLKDAEFYFAKAIELYGRQYGADHGTTLYAQIIRAHVLVALGRLTEARQAYSDGLEGMRQLYGEDHPNTLMALNGLGYCLRTLGRLSEAEENFRKSLVGCRSYFGDDHPNTLTSMLNVGHVLQGQWRLPEAEPLLRRALAGFRARYGDDHPRTLLGLHNMASLLEAQGHLEQAEATYTATLEGRRRVLGPDHQRTITVLSNLGILAMNRGQLEQAETLLGQALSDRRRVLGDEHQQTLTTVEHLGVLMLDLGRLEEAEQLLREALEGRRRVLGEDHPRTLRSQSNLGRVLERRGEVDQAEQLIKGALDSLHRINDVTYPDITSITGVSSSLAALYYRKGDLDRAIETWIAAADAFEVARRQSGAKGLDRTHFATGHSPLAALAACLARSGRPEEAWERFEASLARGLLDTISSRHSRPLNPEEQRRESDLISQLTRLDERLGRLYGIVKPEAREDRESAIERLRTRRDTLLEELSRFQTGILKRYGATAGEIYSLGRIQARIPADTAILGWIDMEPGPSVDKVPGEHWACLIRRSGKPVWVSLPGSGAKGVWSAGDSELTEQLRTSLGKRTRRATARRQRAMIEQVRAQRIDPLTPYLDGIKNLVVLPAGQMAGIPVEVLAEEYTVSYAPSGTVYAWLRERSRTAAGGVGAATPLLLALGDPLFKEQKKQAHSGDATESTTRSAPPPGPEQQERFSRLNPLPGTRKEVEAIADLFGPVGGKPGSMVLLGPEASEERLDELSRSGQLGAFRYIHLATHGVMDDQVAMRSALILSNDRRNESFERVMKGKKVYDGWLTGEQIVRSWKLNAELVTLSGCETALGQEAGGEGYLGFSQALFVAGARSLVLSLWKVDDRATMLLMQRFYQNLLGKFEETRMLPHAEYAAGSPLPRADALREAKCWLRGLSEDQVQLLAPGGGGGSERGPGSEEQALDGRRDHRPFSDPRFWAAFILLGDPG